MNSINEQSDGLSLRAYFRVMWRRKWVILGLAVVCCALAIGYSMTRTPLYQASAQLMYEPQVNVADLASGSSVDAAQRTADLESVATLLTTKSIREDAASRIGSVGDSWYTVKAETQLAADNSGSYSSIVLITGVSPDPDVAAKAANSYAAAFVAWRQQRERDRLQQAADVVQDTLSSYTSDAARATSEYLMLQQQYRNLLIQKQTATGNFSIIVLADPPDAPFSPKVARTGAVGLAGGLVLGLLLAFLLEQFDTRLRSEGQIVTLLPYPVLGRIPRSAKRPSANGAAISMLADSAGPVAESFRMLRNNLDFVNVDGSVRTIIATSSAQREGKSLAICNLAVSLALSGKSVTLVDGDLRNPHVHTYLGLENAVGLSSVLIRGSSLDDAMVTMPVTPASAGPTLHVARQATNGRAGGVVKLSAQGGDKEASDDVPTTRALADRVPVLRVLTSGLTPPNPGELIASSRMKAIIDELSAQCDVLLIDSPAMLVVGDAAALAANTDGLLYVVDPEIARRPMLERAALQLRQLPCRKLGIVEFSGTTNEHYYTYHTSGSGPGNGARRRRSV
jgi:Mrp family chromosome partitioning ATPase/capsular polysaccharide biosynthesis protein